ncbi:aspartate-alanine antiporter [Methylobacterium frigidaeris]|uniref:Aspartate/alanine antiporter n=1 Tax=Methylobacterium frigidaeris TaxID=2038277 RepID=A0AA37HE08_9HYPH|nr:aspartate-alanine antiporter [Methylobacterium frigidaeris]GJD64034.1 Aspartate/alanine antiporter [Methylobacterium frigidaeris]
MFDWFADTLRQYPEIAIFISLAFGYYFGSFSYKGLGIGAVTATLIAAVIIGQIGISVTGPLKPFFFLMFLFAIGYAVGPQFVRGIAKDGLPQALFAVVVCVFCLAGGYLAARLGGYDVGSAAGLYAGSQTISASMGLATDAINRLPIPGEQAKAFLDAMPVAYAITYIFGTLGSAVIIALLGPALLGIDLEAACKRYEEKRGGTKVAGGPGTAWHQFDLRAYRVRPDGLIVGKTAAEAERMLPEQRVYIERLRRGTDVMDVTAETVIQAGDVVAVAGRREVLVDLIGTAAEEVDDRALLAVPIEGLDVYVTSKEVDGKSLADLAQSPWARGVFLRKITRGATAIDIPILPSTRVNRGDILTLVGRNQDVGAATKAIGYPDRATDVADVMFIGGAIAIGALVGAFVYTIGGVPLTLSTSGGALISGLFFGWLRSVRPTFGRIPSSTVWFMNSVGLNVFIAIVGISSGPKFVAGLQQLGFGIFLWGIFATTLPLILALYTGKYLFRFDDAIVLGAVSGARTTTASLGMVTDRAKSQIPGLGYTVTYAVSNTFLTIWGMVLVMLMT